MKTSHYNPANISALLDQESARWEAQEFPRYATSAILSVLVMALLSLCLSAFSFGCSAPAQVATRSYNSYVKSPLVDCETSPSQCGTLATIPFTPTHRFLFKANYGEPRVQVMAVVDGKAYTKAEWESGAAPSWVQRGGVWFYQDSPEGESLPWDGYLRVFELN